MIFAAGYGRRLSPLTFHIPKPLVPIKEKPVLEWIFEKLIRNQVGKIVINTHHLHSKIEAYIQAKAYPVEIEICYEPDILGTGAGFYNTRHLWGEDDIYLCNADILSTANLADFKVAHEQNDTLVTLAVNRKSADSMLLVDESGAMAGLRRNDRDFIFKQSSGGIVARNFCGLHMVKPAFFEQIRPPVAFSIIDEYIKLIEKGVTIATWDIGESYWEDIGTPQSLETAREQFPVDDYASS